MRSSLLFVTILALAVTPLQAHAEPPRPNGDQADPSGPTAFKADVTDDLKRGEWLIAITAAAEARGEADALVAMTLVAEVILNRLDARFMGDKTIEDVVTRRFQFSAWNEDSPMVDDLKRLASGQHAHAVDLEVAANRFLPIARQLVDGKRKRILPHNVLHYVNTAYAKPRWMDGATATLVKGGHTFFADVR